MRINLSQGIPTCVDPPPQIVIGKMKIKFSQWNFGEGVECGSGGRGEALWVASGGTFHLRPQVRDGCWLPALSALAPPPHRRDPCLYLLFPFRTN